MKKYSLSIISAVVVSFLFAAFYAYSSTTISTNISTGGTLTVTGASTLGVLTAGGATALNAGVVFNEDSGDYDFRVESNGSVNALFVDGGNDKVGILTATPNTALEVVGTASSTSLVVGGDSTYGTLSGMVFGTCVTSNITITASSTAGVLCSSASGVRAGDKVFVQATSSLPTNLVIQSASSTAANVIGLYVSNIGWTGSQAIGTISINFFSIR